jgi:hypothetical protein
VSDPYVREVGEVFDLDEHSVTIGVDYDSVTIDEFRFTQAQAEEFAHYFVSACWQAGQNARQMAAETY